jgi:hypothetical protein
MCAARGKLRASRSATVDFPDAWMPVISQMPGGSTGGANHVVSNTSQTTRHRPLMPLMVRGTADERSSCQQT